MGDPLSLYLFNLGVDILSRLIKLVYEGGLAQRVGPLNSGISCMQYADDTIMLLLPDLISIKRVKILIYIFEILSWSSINFHKSSIYPLGPQCLDLSLVSSLLHCKIERFTLTHLRLPLKPTALSKVDWQPLLYRLIRD